MAARYAIVALLIMSAGCSPGPRPAGQTEGPRQGQTSNIVSGQRGMVVSDDSLASEVGVDILQAGGNAADAIVATALALAVTYPEAGNLGGGGFAVLRFANGQEAAIDFRETAPRAATRDMYIDEKGDVAPTSLTGHLASGVPGAVAGLYALHQRYGKLRWPAVVQPAITLAQEGFIVNERFARMAAADERLLRFDASAALFVPNGKPVERGTRWRNPDLAQTLRRVAERGADGFYKGATADLIVAEMKRGGGIITHADLAAYQAKWREPIRFDYRDHRVLAMPPASSGGITLAIMANILEGYDLRASGAATTQTVHLIAEASRRAFADRNFFLGDPDMVRIPTNTLISDAYAQRQRGSIALQTATPSSDIRPGMGAISEGEQTTHISAVDADGNAVALTTTINELFGSAVTIRGAGFLMNDEMDDFSAKPGSPNMFGLVQGEANAIAPGKRMLSAMTPTIVVAPNGQTLLITGARGGPRIISAVFQIMSYVIDHQYPIDRAMEGPRLHHQHLPDVLYHE
ncbi:MAG TPA: gamma-glutamyltransferase, partial [Longimicrobiales bacterium]|nr:gamma-glutamyltransferase [Longimicrobiales bacterium]